MTEWFQCKKCGRLSSAGILTVNRCPFCGHDYLSKVVMEGRDVSPTYTYHAKPNDPPMKTEWVSVEERLPNCNGCYLVWRPHFFGGEIGMPSICYFDGTNTWHDSYGVDFTRILHSEDVTHWMPLQEAPKDGE